MKKKIVYTIAFILLLIVVIVGSTYAFFNATTRANNNATTNSKKFSVIYTGNSLLNGKLTPSANKNGGIHTTVNIRVDQGSAEALAYLYLNIESMSAVLSSTSVKWEIYGVRNSQTVYSNSGTLNGYSAQTPNNKIAIVTDYNLTEADTEFTLYMWIDGATTGNEVIGASFSGYISANTENFTGLLPTNS